MQGDELYTSFSYDQLNRIVQMQHYLHDTIYLTDTFEYDEGSRLVRKTSGNMTCTFQYNPAGQMISLQQTYAGSGHEWEIKYQYEHERIKKGITVFNGKEDGYIEYKYDSRGNTVERNEYAITDEGSGLMLSYHAFVYDDKTNPMPPGSGYPPDIIQHNNPTYSNYYTAFMCSLPPEYHITYDYDEAGLPLREYRQSGYSEHIQVSDYIYIDTE
jgi:hypothetical protein